MEMKSNRYTVMVDDWELAVLVDILEYVVRPVFAEKGDAWECAFLRSMIDRFMLAYGFERGEDGRWQQCPPTAHPSYRRWPTPAEEA